MSNLAVTNHNGVLVVDSRLIAEELGIRHKNFLATIEKYNPKMASSPELGPAAFETRLVKRPQGGIYEERWSWLTEPQATFVMTLSRNTEHVVNCKLALSVAFEQAKQIIKDNISPQSQESERIKLELELAKVKQRYQETGRAIALSTSPVMLAFIRGEAPLPPQVIHRDRFIDPNTGKEVGSAEGRSLTQLITDTGLNPKSTRDHAKVKNILRYYGLDYDRRKGWARASYLREYPILPDEGYDRALRAVVAELAIDEQPNLFVNQHQQQTLPSSGNNQRYLEE